jgi:hypothetical protein
MASGQRRFLGRTIGGRVTLLAARFDPKAEDGDGDGMVQDGTQWQRPAVASAIARRISNARGNRRNQRQINRVERRKPSRVADLFRALRSDANLDVPEIDIPGRPKEGYRDAAVTAQQIIDLRVKIKNTVQEKFGDINNGEKARKAIRKVFPNASIKEVDFGNETQELNPNERSAVETLLFLGLNNPNLSRGLKTLVIKDPRNTDEYRDAVKEFMDASLLRGGPNYDQDREELARLTLTALDAKIQKEFGFQSGSHALFIHDDGTYGSNMTLSVTGDPSSFLPYSYDDRSEIMKNYLHTISVNEHQRNWHPINEAMIKLNDSLKKSNTDDQKRIDTIDEFRAMALVLHEWGHFDHTTSIMEKEFGFTEWDESAAVQQEKLFSVMNSDDKVLMVYTALLESRMWEGLTNLENQLNKNLQKLVDEYRDALASNDVQLALTRFSELESQNAMYQEMIDFAAIRLNQYRLMSQMAHNAYGNDEFREESFKQLQAVKDSLKQFGINLEDLENSAWIAVDLMPAADRDQPKTLQEFKDQLKPFFAQIGVSEENFEIALRLGFNHKFEQKLLDSLSEEEAIDAIRRLPKVSNYAGTMYNMWTANTINWGSMEAEMIPYSIHTAMMEGIAELFLAKMFGYKTPFIGPEAMISFLQTKRAKMNNKKVKNIDTDLELPSDRSEHRSSCNTKFFEQYVEPDDRYVKAIKASKDVLNELKKKPFKFDNFSGKED